MDPFLPAEMEGEEKERRKIQFSIPSSVPSQLDPRQVEMIRRRRPTPATLFRLTDLPSPEEENANHQWVAGEKGVLKPIRVNPAVYQPPSLKAVQRMAQAHMQALGTCAPLEDPPEGGEGEDCASSDPESEDSQEDTRSDQSEHLLGSKVAAKETPHTPQTALGRNEENEDGEKEEKDERKEEVEKEDDEGRGKE